MSFEILEFHPQTVLDEVVSHGPDRGFRVAGRTNGKVVSWDGVRPPEGVDTKQYALIREP